MKIVFQIVFAVGAIASLLVVSHYIFLAIHKPQHLLRFIADLEKTTKGKIYYGFLFIGSFAATYCGIKGLLFWLPASISSADVYSESPPLKDMLAGMLALFSLPMIGSVEEFARSKVRRRYLEKENEELKSLLTQLSGLKDKLDRYEELRKGSVDPDEQFLYARLQELGHRLGAQMSTLLKATIFEEKRKREEQLEREAKQSEATKRKTEIACQLYNYRNALDVATNRDRFEIVRSLEHVANGALCLIDPIFVMQKWQALERTAASVLSLSDKEIQNGTKTPFSINGLFETFVGISVVAPLTVMAAY